MIFPIQRGLSLATRHRVELDLVVESAAVAVEEGDVTQTVRSSS